MDEEDLANYNEDYGVEEAATKASENGKRRYQKKQTAKLKSENSVSLDDEDFEDEHHKKHW